MRLTLAHRLTALGLLPTEGSFVTLRIVRDAQHALSPSAEEIERFQIVQDGQQVRWVGDTTADVPLSSAAMTLLKDALAKDRKSTRLNSSHIPLSRMPSSA